MAVCSLAINGTGLPKSAKEIGMYAECINPITKSGFVMDNKFLNAKMRLKYSERLVFDEELPIDKFIRLILFFIS